MVPSLCYKVDNDNNLHGTKHVLHLFLFLERKSSVREVEGENNQWAFLMDITASVRANFLAFVSRCADRISKAVCPALNKLLHNYSSNAEVHT